MRRDYKKRQRREITTSSDNKKRQRREATMRSDNQETTTVDTHTMHSKSPCIGTFPYMEFTQTTSSFYRSDPSHSRESTHRKERTEWNRNIGEKTKNSIIQRVKQWRNDEETTDELTTERKRQKGQRNDVQYELVMA